MDESVASLDALIDLGGDAAKRGDLDAALVAYERGLGIELNSLPAVAGKIRALNRLARYREALDMARWALDHADQYKVPYLCAEALHGLSRDEEALPLIERALWLGPREAAFHHMHGVILFALARDEEAVTAFETALATSAKASKSSDHETAAGEEESTPDSLSALQAARERAARRAESLALLDRRRSDHPEDAVFWEDIAQKLRNLGQGDLADALVAAPTPEKIAAVPSALLAGVGVNTVRDQPQYALTIYERVLEIAPERIDALYGRANVLYALGRIQEALDMVALIPPQTTVNHSTGWFVRGQILRANGRLDAALGCYGRALALGPWMEPWRREQAALLEQMGREHDAHIPLAQAELFSGLNLVGNAGRRSSPRLYMAALAHFDQAIELDPTLRFAEGEAAAALVRLGRHEEALARLEKALERAPHDVYLLVVKGFAVTASGNPEAALAAFDEALALSPTNIGWTGRVGALVRLGRDEEAVEAIKSALSLDNEDDAAWALWSELLMKSGRHEEALGAINAALEWERLLSREDHVELERIQVATAGTRRKQAVDRDDLLALYHAKVAALRQVGRDEAADELAKLLPFREAEPHVDSAQAFFAEARYDEALAEFREALELDPEGRKVWLPLGDTLAALGRDDEALVAFKEALQQSAGNIREIYNRANMLTNAHRHEQALPLLEAALAAWPSQERWFPLSVLIPPNEMEAYMLSLKGKILSETGHYAEALDCQERALELAPDLHFVWRNKGRALTQLRRWDESVTAFERALALDDSIAYDWHSLAYALYKGERYLEALPAIERAIALDPSPPIVGTKGQIYLKLGEYPSALEWLDRALDADPDDREHWEAKAKTLRALGRDEEAQIAEDKASSTT